ncbi:hypothetical protein GCM10007103_25950 [Salinimicrobium marinum]|uniref:DUF922 domain-containing protein n=1 Tax=Salinimicrobium marinum TaxID=680283 RepID=A0A918W030_9FLAO|nr:DUF922 domain-containing protein [Salinimicrobium marinum]GHA43596.1 hypothetical protein GCM10007103_25950 [Salinimicrobium marinum]
MYRFIVGAFLFINAVGFAQETEEKISWEEENPLDWSLFQGEPKLASPFHAETNSGISHSFSVKQSDKHIEFDFDVRSFFIPAHSWVKEGERSEYLLGHEQLHFDITELHARKLRKALQEYKIGKGYKRELQNIYKKIQSQSHQMQQKYDAETGHSLNREAEMEWRQFVKSELEKFKDYSK